MEEVGFQLVTDGTHFWMVPHSCWCCVPRVGLMPPQQHTHPLQIESCFQFWNSNISHFSSLTATEESQIFIYVVFDDIFNFNQIKHFIFYGYYPTKGAEKIDYFFIKTLRCKMEVF